MIAVAHHLANKTDIVADSYNEVEAKNFLEGEGFVIESKQEKYELIITADNVTSTDDRFTIDNIGLGDNYKPLDSYFKSTSGEVVRRMYNKGERRSSNQTMPRIVFQVFEKQIAALTVDEKRISRFANIHQPLKSLAVFSPA